MEDIINRVKDCIQKTTNIYKQEQFNKFIDNYNNVLTFQGDKKENLQKMFNILLQYDDKEKINFEDLNLKSAKVKDLIKLEFLFN